MNKIFAILGGLGVGAGLMYLLDPERGRTRRALVRDKAVKFNRQASEAITGQVKDIGNRAKGLMHEGKSLLTGDERRVEESPNRI